MQDLKVTHLHGRLLSVVKKGLSAGKGGKDCKAEDDAKLVTI